MKSHCSSHHLSHSGCGCPLRSEARSDAASTPSHKDTSPHAGRQAGLQQGPQRRGRTLLTGNCIGPRSSDAAGLRRRGLDRGADIPKYFGSGWACLPFAAGSWWRDRPQRIGLSG
jgi:hypothetical protein